MTNASARPAGASRFLADEVRMRMWITNGTKAALFGLVVQICVLLKAAVRFDQRTNENKVFEKPYVACRNADGTRWIITAWKPCVRAWANAPCPCFHSDLSFPTVPRARRSRFAAGSRSLRRVMSGPSFIVSTRPNGGRQSDWPQASYAILCAGIPHEISTRTS